MAEEKKQDEELKLTAQEDGSVIIGDEAPPPEKPEPEGDAKLGAGDEHGEGEETGHADETPEEAEARRQRNRERRAQNKERRKDYIDTLKRDLAARDAMINELNQRVSVVERRSSGSEMAQLEAAEKEALGFYNQFKTLHGQAVEQANGQLAGDAMEKMMLSRQRLDQIANIKKAMTAQQAAPATTQLDPRLKQHAETWMANNSWFDINGGDEDSRVALALDQAVRDEGYRPETPEYWEALDSKKKKYLPHRVNSGYNQGKQTPRSPVAGSGRDSGAGKGGGSYHLSAERVNALKEAGIYDDPKARAEAIKRYQQYDKETQNG